MAHFHIPKPLHGWREFVGEVGIIVLGVLIALGFEQLVEQWRWRQEVRATRQALANELALSAEQGDLRLAVEDCLHDRAAELAGKLNANKGSWKADPLELGGVLFPHWDHRSIGRVYAVPLRGWSQDAWDNAKSSGVLNHMSHDEVASYSSVYSEIAAIRDFQNQELQLESNLSFLSSDQQLDNRSRIDALGKVGQLDALNAVITGLSSLMIEELRNLHLRLDRVAGSEEFKQTIKTERQYLGRCVKDVPVNF